MRTRVIGAVAAACLAVAGVVAIGSPDEGGLTQEQRMELKARITALKTRAADAERAGRQDEARAAMREVEELMVKLKGPKKAKRPRPKGPQDLIRTAEELLEKARHLRERGSVEDAEHLETKAHRLREAHALRVESNELEHRGKEARAAGHEEDAKRLFSESGRAWRHSEELLAGKPTPHREREARRPRPPEDELHQRLEHLRSAERHAREAGSHDVADVLARQAEEAEHALRGRDGMAAEIRELREEVAALRRRVRELEERLSERDDR